MKTSRKDSQSADAAYEAIAARNAGRVPDLVLVRDEIVATMPVAAISVLQDEYYWQLTRGADERALKRGRSPQLGLFSGVPEALDGFVSLGDQARVKKRYMLNADWVTHLQLMNGNVQDVNLRYLTEQADHSKLLPYLAQGMTTEDALAAWRRAHPQASSGTP